MRQPNIILIVLDTLRRDTLYSQLSNTNAFRRLVNDALVYQNAIAPAAWTVPSHASIFTGKYVSEHGIHIKKDERSRVETLERANSMVNTLPAQLKVIGYDTYSFSSNTLVSKGTEFSSGFDTCELAPLREVMEALMKSIAKAAGKSSGSFYKRLERMISSGRILDIVSIIKDDRKMAEYFRRIGYPRDMGGGELTMRIINANPKPPFFLFVNFMEAHEPYSSSPPFSPIYYGWREKKLVELNALGMKEFSNRFVKKSLREYRNSVFVLDRFLEQLTSYLKKNSLYDESLIVITADHGQAFREKDYYGHGNKLYDELIRIPLIVKYPDSVHFDLERGYQTLVDMKDFILSFATGIPKSYETRESVFSEEYENSFRRLARRENCNLENNFIVRKAIFRGNMKLVIDGTIGRIEEFLLNERACNYTDHLEEVRELISELDIFVGNQEFRLPTLGLPKPGGNKILEKNFPD